MAKTREISRRIKSISSTKKITRAMEMVSAAKMRKAVEAVLKTRTYASLSWEAVLHLAKLAQSRSEELHPLLTMRPKIGRVAVILITSNRGMCGGYNSAIIAKAKASVKKHQVPTDFILIGRKGAVIGSSGYDITAQFEKSDIITDAKEIRPIAKLVLEDYYSGKYDKVFVAYTDFVNAVRQTPRVKQILPVTVDAFDEYLGAIDSARENSDGNDQLENSTPEDISEYTFEPTANEVLNLMVPRLLEIQLYQALLESNASEHSASMAAMHQATEAATDMVSELTLFYNKSRQASITSEIAEISAGANALAG